MRNAMREREESGDDQRHLPALTQELTQRLRQPAAADQLLARRLEWEERDAGKRG